MRSTAFFDLIPPLDVDDQRHTEFTYGNGLFGGLFRMVDRAEGLDGPNGSPELDQAFWVEELKIEGQTVTDRRHPKKAKTSKTKTAQRDEPKRGTDEQKDKEEEKKDERAERLEKRARLREEYLAKAVAENVARRERR